MGPVSRCCGGASRAHPRFDWEGRPDEGRDARTQLQGVYGHLVRYYHQPKLHLMQERVALHRDRLVTDVTMQHRVRRCERLLALLGALLNIKIEVMEDAPFGFVRLVSVSGPSRCIR